VRRLFQYFALHRATRVPRDQVLDEVWPETDPRSAATTFRTIYSWLRGVLEPHLRPKAPSRYFLVEGDIYTFDPHDRVRLDIEQFEQTVRAALNAAGQPDLPPLPPALLQALEGWRPLLPDLPYADWLAVRREQLHTLYAEGGLYAAQAYLARGALAEAMTWARRVIAVAPWLEEAYQVLMRGHARQGERSLALRLHAELTAVLARELGAPPSPLSNWLAARLRQGDEI
jgi:DNA-binding SARP family transcriptional activator